MIHGDINIGEIFLFWRGYGNINLAEKGLKAVCIALFIRLCKCPAKKELKETIRVLNISTT